MKKQQWWNNSFIDRRTYLLEQFQNTDFSDNDMLLILMIDLQIQKNGMVREDELAKSLKREISDIHASLGKLVNDGWINVSVTSKTVSYSLDPIFEAKPMLNVSQTLFDKFEEQLCRPLSSTEINMLGSWMQIYEEEFIEAALREALIYQKMSFNYINKILENWRLQNKTIEDINNAK